MKNKTLLLTFTAVLALGLAGCSKNEPVTPAADNANKAASSAADAADKTAEAAKVEAAKADQAAKVEAAKADQAAKVEAAKVAEAAKVEAAKAAEAAKVAEAANNSKIQELIDKAKNLIAETNYTDASSVLQQLAGQSLSGEQTKLVNGLKDQIQKAIAAKAAENAAGDLLKK
jgi:hypothetical protein